MRAFALTLFLALLLGSLFALDAGRAHSDGAGGNVTVTVSAIPSDLLRVKIVAPPSGAEVTQGTKFRVTVEVENSGTGQLKPGEATLFFDQSGLSTVQPQTRRFGALNGGQTKQLHWDVRVADDADPVSYVLTVEVTATLSPDGTVVSGEDSVTVTVAPLIESAILGVRIADIDGAGDILRGSRFRIGAEVINLGETPLPPGAVTLYVDSAGLSVDGAAAAVLGSLDPGQSVQVYWDVSAAELGLYAVTVEASTTLGVDGPAVTVAAPALLVTVVEAALDTVDALTVEITAIEPAGDIAVGERVRVTASVTNTGLVGLRDGEVVLSVDSSGLNVVGNAERRFGRLDPGATEERDWRLRAEAEGVYGLIVSARATLGLKGPEVSAESAPATITVVAPVVSALKISIDGVEPAGVIMPGTEFEVIVSVTNLSAEEVGAVSVTFAAESDGLVLLDDATRQTGPLASEETVLLRWTLRADAAGLFPVNATVVAASDDGDAPLSGGSPSALIEVVEDSAPAEPLVVTILEVVPEGEIAEGTDFRIVVELRNEGSDSLPAGEAILHVDMSGLTVGGSASQPFDAISPGVSLTLEWTVSAGDLGRYELTVEANARDAEGERALVSAVAPAVSITVVESDVDIGVDVQESEATEQQPESAGGDDADDDG